MQIAHTPRWHSQQYDFNQPMPVGQALSDINAGNLASDELRDKHRWRHLHMSNNRHQ